MVSTACIGASCGISACTAAEREHERGGDDPRRPGLHLELAVEQRQPRGASALEVGGLVHQARVALPGLLAGLLLLLGDHRLEHEPVVLLVEARADLLADALELGLAAQLDLVQECGELVGDDPAGRLLLGSARATAAPGLAIDRVGQRRRDAVEVRRRPGGFDRAVLVDVGVAEAARDRRVSVASTISSMTPTSRRGSCTAGETSTVPRSSVRCQRSMVWSVTASCSGWPGASSSARAPVVVERRARCRM